MHRFSRFMITAAFAINILSSDIPAHASRCRRWRTCCCPCKTVESGFVYTCLKRKVYTIGPDDYLYYGDEYPNICDDSSGAQSVPNEDGDHTDLPESCTNSNCRKDPALTRCSRNHNWQGLDHRLLPGEEPSELSGSICDFHYACFTICKENRSYKAVVFDVCVDGAGTTIHVAYELDHFPPHARPYYISLGAGNCNDCNQFGHAYSLKYFCKHVLFLTAKDSF
jgi:hypothetical protein